MLEASVRGEVVRHCAKLWSKGFVANHDGNVSARPAPNRIVCTPTSTSKIDVTERSLLVVDAQGKVLQGEGKPFGELPMHLAVYRGRPDVKAVVHAHPPHATALGVTGRELLVFLPEAVVSLGTRVPVAPLAIPGAEGAAALGPYIDRFDAVLAQGNGVWAWGESVEQAYLRLELVEHLATIAHHAQAWGGAPALPEPTVKKLLEARKKYFPRTAKFEG